MRTKWVSDYSGAKAATLITTDYTILGTEAYGGVFSNRTATQMHTVTLPAAKAGMSITLLREHPYHRFGVDPVWPDYIDRFGVGVRLDMDEVGVLQLRSHRDGEWTSYAVKGLVYPAHSQPATYYMATTGNDANDGSVGSPRLTLQGAIPLLKPGDVLVIEDGSYSGSLNDLTAAFLPNGMEDRWITIKARNIGQVKFANTLNIDPGNLTGVFITNHVTKWYVQFHGIIWNKAEAKVFRGRFVKFFCCGFRGSGLGGTGTPSGDNVHSVSVGGGNSFYRGAADILFEDCFVWGPGGRNKMIAYNSERVIFRRCVVRWDQGWQDGTNEGLGSGYPANDIVIYDSADCEAQNCISIDSLRPARDPQVWGGSFALEHNYYHCENVAFRGCIAINNEGGLLKLTGLTYDPLNGVPYGQANVVRRTRVRGVIVEHCFSSRTGSTDWYDAMLVGAGYDVIIANCTVTNLKISTGRGFVTDLRAGLVRGLRVEDCVFASVSNPANAYSGYTGWTPTNLAVFGGITALTDALLAGLKYPCRLEPGSTLDLAYQGATILKKYGTQGSLFGDPGYKALGQDDVTATPLAGAPVGAEQDDLWPWPIQSVIKTAMSAAGGFGDVDRGWTATGLTLTEYVWRELGDPTGPPVAP